MSVGNLSLSEKYRPQRFDDFVGKVEAVAYLLRQVREDRGRSVLLHGPSGCGKSSLGEVYAAGLLCTASTERPCRSAKCGSCSSIRYGTHLNLKNFHYGRMADEEFADQINADVRAETFGNGHFVVLINRANLLSERAFDILHDQMKRPYERVTFILCADGLNAVPREVASLFYPLRVKPPGFAEAAEYLKRVCELEGISIDAEGVEILADFGRSRSKGWRLTLSCSLSNAIKRRHAY
jgi:DNA polymerase-3 subunit gamma/tau